MCCKAVCTTAAVLQHDNNTMFVCVQVIDYLLQDPTDGA
jgi:hypothetical protein